MEIYEEAKRYVDELRSLPDFLARSRRKGQYIRQGDFAFVGTRCGKLVFRLGPRLEWSTDKMQKIEAIGAAYGLTCEWGNSVHLLRDGAGIASIHDTGLENDLAVRPGFEQARELFADLAIALVGVLPTGPVQWPTTLGSPRAGRA